MSSSIKVSKRSVDALRVTGVRYVAWDTDIPGFGVRVGVSGARTYILKYRLGGGRSARIRWGVIGQHGSLTPDQARDIAKRWAAEVAMGGDPAGDRLEHRKAPTVSALLDRYLSDHVAIHNKPSTRAYVLDIVSRLVLPDPLARLKIRDVTDADIARFLVKLAKTPTTANRVRSALSKAFALAETWGYRDKGSNPCRSAQKHREKHRERFLSPAEIAALGEALLQAERGELRIPGQSDRRAAFVSPGAVAAIRLLLFTGARRGEILGLRWEWIDLPAGVARLPDSKTGAKTLILPPAACQVLSGLDRPKSGAGYVIRNSIHQAGDRPLVNLKKPWDLVRSAAGLEDVRLHDLRHTFASFLVSSGYSLPVIGALLGHKDSGTTQRYAHLSSDPLRAAADHAGEAFGGIMKADISHSDA